jgi:hypothetical protein
MPTLAELQAKLDSVRRVSEPDAGAGSTHQRLVETLENLRDLNIGLGTPVTFSESEHQGMHKVWGTRLDEFGHFQPIDLQ